MSYVSLLYLLLFLPTVLLIYKLLPQRHRWKILLIASYVFFYSISKNLLVFIILSTASIHYIGIWLSSCKTEYKLNQKNTEDKAVLKAAYMKKRRRILWLGIAFNIGILLFLKYFNFFGSNVNALLSLVSSPVLIPALKLAVPIGISFYTLQAVSYIVDVYYGKIEADDNLGRLALYLSFFPAIMEGPISRYSQIAHDLYAGHDLKYKNVTFGLQRFAWGLFKKLVIADRLNPLVKTVFEHHDEYGGIIIILGAILYTFQLYADFSGCIDMTIGTGEMFGVSIPENFRQPFFAKTASEFWHRWHITLGTWFKDYIFYPLSLTKGVKKLGKTLRNKCGKHLGQVIQSSIPLFAVWFCNGLWHGTGWNYLFFGFYYFVLIIMGNLFEPYIQKTADRLHINREGHGYRAFQTVKMLAIIFTGELFFRADGLGTGISMFTSIFTKFDLSVLMNGSILKLGLSGRELIVAVIGLIVVLIVGIIHEKGISIREKVAAMPIYLRWSFYYAAILTIIIFGAYGNGYSPADMLYANF